MPNQLLHAQVNTLLLYQDVLADEPGQRWQELLGASDRQLLPAYSAWFRSLAERRMGWQDYLIDRLLKAENPFTTQVQQADWSDLPMVMRQAVNHDLRILREVYSYSCQQIYQWVKAATGEETVPWIDRLGQQIDPTARDLTVLLID